MRSLFHLLGIQMCKESDHIVIALTLFDIVETAFPLCLSSAPFISLFLFIFWCFKHSLLFILVTFLDCLCFDVDVLLPLDYLLLFCLLHTLLLGCFLFFSSTEIWWPPKPIFQFLYPLYFYSCLHFWLLFLIILSCTCFRLFLVFHFMIPL